MNKPGEKKREPTESTFLATMARVPLKSNFSINAILPEIADRDTPPDDDGSPAPSAPSEMDDASSDGDVNVDYESENEGKQIAGKYDNGNPIYYLCGKAHKNIAGCNL